MHPERNAAIYARVSSEEQVKGYSLDEQVKLGRERAAIDGYSVAEQHVFIDAGISGARVDRPRYQALFAAASAGEFGALYVWKFDRLGRDAEELLRARRMLEAAGVTIVSLTEGEAESTLVYGVRALVAQEEREKISERTRMGLAARAAKGGHHGGPAPFGYRYRDADPDGRPCGELEPDPVQAPIVARIFAAFVGGASLRAIVDRLNGESVQTSRGKALGISAVATVLDNPFYAGYVRFGRETCQGLHEPLIDEDSWTEAQRLRHARRLHYGADKDGHAKAGRNPQGPFLLVRGILRCGSCGSAMRPRTDKRGRKDAYICITHDRDAASCPMPRVFREDVDEALLEHFAHVHLDLDATRERLVAASHQAVVEAAANRDSVERELLRKTEELTRIRTDYRNGSITAEEWHEFRDEIADEKRALHAQLARLGQREEEARERLAAIDAETEMLSRLAGLREAVAGRITGSGDDVNALRAAIAAVFSRIELRIDEDGELGLVPRVHVDPDWQPTPEEAETLRRAAAGEPIEGFLPGNYMRTGLALDSQGIAPDREMHRAAASMARRAASSSEPPSRKPAANASPAPVGSATDNLGSTTSVATGARSSRASSVTTTAPRAPRLITPVGAVRYAPPSISHSASVANSTSGASVSSSSRHRTGPNARIPVHPATSTDSRAPCSRPSRAASSAASRIGSRRSA
jgi:site-specific DNA recombinase